jgi:GNAT superfamily N-acetyltransferase
MTALRFKEVRGEAAAAHLSELARLRMAVFREFPYLYEGDLGYEQRYLSTYFSCPQSFVALCYDEDKIVGASTAIPLAAEEEAFQQPFRSRGLEPERICYYGESVLLPDYRGRGVGRRFMESREAFARSLPGVTAACFCAVVRPDRHPLQPSDYRPLDEFWRKLGFRRLEGFVTKYSWKETGEDKESPKTMQFWMKDL